MYRKFLRELESWEDGKVKEPLLVTGARQVGKTWLIKSFCEERYDDHVYINLEEQQSIASVFEGDLDPATLLRNIGILLGRRIDSNTAIFIDEIQVRELQDHLCRKSSRCKDQPFSILFPCRESLYKENASYGS